jgi:sugar phosphate isomerase/epimerase
MVEDAIAQLLSYAAEHHVQLAIEPLHPMFAADCSVIVTLAEANRLIEHFASKTLGIIVDVYHVWWDPDVYTQITRATGHIMGFHNSRQPRSALSC